MHQPYPPQPQPGWAPPPAPRPPRWGRFVLWTGVAAVAAFTIGGGLAVLMKDDGGGSSVANPAACKTALAENYRRAMADGPDGPTQAAPPACSGLSPVVLERITGEVMAEYLESPEAEEDLGRLLEGATATP